MQGFDVKRLYFGRRPKEALDKEGVTLVKDLEEFLGQCDVVTVNVPLTDKTRWVFGLACHCNCCVIPFACLCNCCVILHMGTIH